MRRIFIVSVIVCFVSLIFLSIITHVDAAEVTRAEGKVQAQFKPDVRWRVAELGTLLQIGDSLRTARNSIADIALDDTGENMISVEEQSLVILNSTIPGEINRIDLSAGEVFSNIEKLKTGLTFEISTPSSVAGVRGTGFKVNSTRRKDEIAVFENQVYVKTYDKKGGLISELLVPQGYKTIVERFEAAGELIRLTEEEKRHWEDIRERMSERGKEKDEEKKKKKDKARDSNSGSDEYNKDTKFVTDNWEENIGGLDEIRELIEDNTESLPDGYEDINYPSEPDFED